LWPVQRPGAAADVLACGLAPGEGVRSLRDVAPIDFLGLAREIRVPILIVNGWRDVIARPRERAFLAAAPDATIEIVARAGHLLPVERPNELAALIGAFAERTRRLLPEQRPED
jgi:pimeloyl-ACP methyl ester carboxylesterase